MFFVGVSCAFRSSHDKQDSSVPLRFAFRPEGRDIRVFSGWWRGTKAKSGKGKKTYRRSSGTVKQRVGKQKCPCFPPFRPHYTHSLFPLVLLRIHCGAHSVPFSAYIRILPTSLVALVVSSLWALIQYLGVSKSYPLPHSRRKVLPRSEKLA